MSTNTGNTVVTQNEKKRNNLFYFLPSPSSLVLVQVQTGCFGLYSQSQQHKERKPKPKQTPQNPYDPPFILQFSP